MKKYPLVLSTPDKFIGEIPANNIKNILNFKTVEKDSNYFPVPNILSTPILSKDIEDIKTIVVKIVQNLIRVANREHTLSRLERLKKEHGGNLIDSLLKLIFPFDVFMLGMSEIDIKKTFQYNFHQFVISFDDDYNFCGVRAYPLNNSSYDIIVSPYIESKKPEFWVLATADQFDVKGSEIVAGGKIIEVGEGYLHIPLKDDPIIFKPIKEGLIVVDQWGYESTLPEFLNENNN